ncbi:MAG: VCBS repeat-containing protein, partial [Methyloprofundus sp.]|nr:VCBS repeat-containing protein [Methyloprofundus sp.]
MIKKHFNLTKAAKHRALFSSILTASLSFSAIGGEVLEYYDPYRLLELPTITTPGESYVFVDIDDDGDQDAFRQNVFFENIGSAAKPSYIERVGDENPASDIPSYSKLEFVDIDADGDLDVFIGFQKSVSVGELYENTGSAQLATFVKRGINDLGDLYSSLPTRFSFVDIDDDGDQDVFLEDGFYENTGAEGAPFFTKKVLSHLDALNTLIAESYALPVFIDLDEDGDLDAFYKHGADLLFLENTGDASKATFNSTVDMGVSFNNDRKPIWQAVNIDADSDIDLVIDGTPLFNDGSLGLDAFDFTKIQSRLETRGMSFADLDGDLDADAFLVGVSGGKYSSGLNTVLQYTNEGNMVFATDPVPWAGEHISSSVAFSTQFVDLDQDGDLDQLVYIDDTLKFFENIATAISPEMVEKTGSDNAFSSIVLESGGRIAPEFVDIDDDGDLDFFTLDSVPEESGSVFEIAFYKNIGTVDAAEYQRELLETPFLIHIDSFVNNNKRFAFSDIDLDGDQDLLIADSRGLRLHKNIGDKQNANFILQDIELSPLKNISIPADGVYGLKFVDIDNNGDKDLIINDNLLYLSRRVEKDTDSDGLPDDWETLYGLDPTNPDDGGLHSDKDGDGYSNYVEFLSGTDPNDPNDPGGSASDPCLSNPISSVIHIDNKQYSSLDDITCQASEGISLTGDVTLSSGTQASFSAPLIHILP